MALRINHNITALNAQRNLALTTRSIGNVMEKLSSGFRINRASDDPAGLVISEQFRAPIADLNRAISNSEGSIAMIQTAEGSLNEINSLLVSMSELAIHAANEGFNDTNQLAADQAEIENAIQTIDRIALRDLVENKAWEGKSETLQQLAEKLNEAYRNRKVSLNFSIDEETETLVVKMIDQETDKVLRQIPPDEILAIKRNIRSMLGVIFDKEAEPHVSLVAASEGFWKAFRPAHRSVRRK